MNNKNFKMVFPYINDLKKYGKENLLNELLNVINDIDDKYILKINGMAKELYNLFEFENYDDLRNNLHHKNIAELKDYLNIIVDNIFKSLNNKNSFVNKCFNNYMYNNNERDFKIEFNCKMYNVVDNDNYKTIGEHYSLNFSLISYQKYTNCGCGGGRSFTFDLVNSELLNDAIKEVDQLSLSNSIKELYIDYFNQEYDYNFNIENANKYVISIINDYINNFIYPIEDNLKQYYTLKEQNLKEKLQEYMNENEYTKNILEDINIDYKQYKGSSHDIIMGRCKEGDMLIIDENNLEIRFLGEIIKTISKSSYTVYEIEY